MSGSNNQAFNATIPRDCGNFTWEAFSDDNTWLYQIQSASSFTSIYTISMPFQVSKATVSFASYPSYSQFGYLNRSDRSSFIAITSTNNSYNEGDSVTINVNNSITLMKAPNTSLRYNFEYILKLFPGYLAFGISSTLSSNYGDTNVILRDITLNIIAYR